MQQPNTLRYFQHKLLLLYIPILVLLLISINLTLVWKDAKFHDYIPCAENCGEAFPVLKYIQDYHLYGFKYGLIEDRSTSLGKKRIPYLYTHNANIPGIVFVLLDTIGLKQLYMKQFFTLFIHGLGLFYIFLAVSYLARSSILGVIVLSLFCLDYEFVFNFALNPLRAWHWLVLFGLLYHTSKLVLESTASNLHHKIAMFIFNICAFGLGYDFFVITFVITFLMLCIKVPKPLFQNQNRYIICLFSYSAILPIMVRQLQIIYILGIKFWIMDVLLSIATKVTFLNFFFKIPSNEAIAHYFLSVGVYRPVTTASLPINELLMHVKMLITYILLPITGLSTLLLTIFVSVVAILITVLSSTTPGRTFLRMFVKENSWQKFIAVAHLIVIIVFGSIIGIAIFPQHNIQIYVKHLAPLLVASFFLIKATIINLLLPFAKLSTLKYLHAKDVMCVSILIFIIADHGIIQINNLRTKQPYTMTWISAVQKHPNASYAISWMPLAISVFINNDVVALTLSQQTDLLNRIRLGKAPVEKVTDYTLENRTPDTVKYEQLKKIDYWLYFSTDNMTPFDYPTITNCRMDYLSTTLAAITRSNRAYTACSNRVASNSSPMPNVSKLIAENPNIPIVARGTDWVLFDLRHFS